MSPGRAKVHDRLLFLRPDVADALRGYLAAGRVVLDDAASEARRERVVDKAAAAVPISL